MLLWKVVFRIFSLSLFILVVSGCGREYNVSGFESYVSSFEESAHARGVDLAIADLVIEFGTPAAPTADATCYQGGNTVPRIVIDQKKWDAMPEAKRTALLFHEMGHCVLDRPHLDGAKSGSSCPVSVMNSYTLSATCYSSNEDYYLSELFGKG